MGAAAIQGHVVDQRERTQVTINTRSPATVEVMSCEACAEKFNLFKRKKLCQGCGRNFCSDCAMRITVDESPTNILRSSFRQCKKCRAILSGNFTRSDLMLWKLKDLKGFMTHQRIPTERCKEKHDLVDLLMTQFSPGSPSSTQHSDHQKHVEELAQRMRMSKEEETRRQAPPSPRPSANLASQPAPGPSAPTLPTEPSVNIETSDSVPPSQSSAPPGGAPDPQAAEPGSSLEEEEDMDVDIEEEISVDADNSTTSKHRMTLDELKTLSDIEKLTVRQLKQLLVTNFVDYKGCCEKWELMGRVKRLWTEHQANYQTDEGKAINLDEVEESEICKVCMDAVIDCVLLECGHMVSCTRCGRRLAECPICRQYVVRAVHIFKT